MKTKIFLVLAAVLALSLVLPGVVLAAKKDIPDRGRYVYDEGDRLSAESAVSLGSYLWQVDAKTDYEIVISLPDKKFSDKEIIDWFNGHGVGKEGLDNGAVIFVFPDNSWFVAIGSGNDKISVPHSKTYGDKILTRQNLENDLVLSLLRYIETLNREIEELIPKAQPVSLWEKVSSNLMMILLWMLFISLAVFIYQQKDGFQKRDLIIPILLMVFLGIFVGISALGSSGSLDSYTDYGVITSTKLDERHYVTAVVISTGKTTSVIYVPHTDYINQTTLLNYENKPYSYKFVSTDNKSAWEIAAGEYVALTIHAKSGKLISAHRFKDFSGGKTIGDGVWGP